MRTISNKQKALIHVAKAKLGMDDMEYLAMLDRVGVQSSRDLTHAKFKVILKHLNALGFTPRTKFYRPAGSKKRLMSKLLAIKKDLGLTDAYIDAIAQTMFKNREGGPIESYRWLPDRELYKLVQALSCHQVRTLKRAGKKGR